MLTRFDPVHDFDRLVDQWFEGGSHRPLASSRVMPLDVNRIGDKFVIDIDLPGVHPESVDISVDAGMLSVKAERSPRRTDQETIVSERPHGTFLRQLSLGDGLDLERVEANYHDGVLTITVPVAEASKPKKITITSGGDSQVIDTHSSPMSGQAETST